METDWIHGFAALLALAPLVQAAGTTQEPQIGKKVTIEASLAITKYDDGRIAPVANADKLTAKQLDAVLRQMNLSEEDLKTYPEGFKKSSQAEVV